MTTTTFHTTTTAAKPVELPAFTRTRRALIRMQSARATRKIIAELAAQPEPKHGQEPTFARLDELVERYAALGGEPADLLGRRRNFTAGEAIRGFGRAVQARHEDWLRRELDAGQTARAHRYETGGDFSVLS